MTARSTVAIRRMRTPGTPLAVNIGITRPPITVTKTMTSPVAASAIWKASPGWPLAMARSKARFSAPSTPSAMARPMLRWFLARRSRR
ncbi:hypothetical protein D3C85_1642760 [compost metagenome]